MNLRQITQHLKQTCHIEIEYGAIMLQKANKVRIGKLTAKQFVTIKSKFQLLRIQPDYSSKILYQIT